jgi:hypothetical protein
LVEELIVDPIPMPKRVGKGIFNWTSAGDPTADCNVAVVNHFSELSELVS